MPAVEDTTAKEGDLVHWIFPGSPNEEFAIIFESVQNSPFDWSQNKGTQVWGCVKKGAATGCALPGCKYSVDVNGKVQDPRIIIEP